MKPTLPRLYLIRHGETEWSRSGRHTGRTDLPLTEQGTVMARRLRPYLANTPFELVLTSPLLRARDTCMLAGLGEQARISADLSEWDYGDYEGRSSDDICKEAPGWNIFRDGCPNGETPAQVAERADRLIAGILALEGNIALFSHGHFGCALAVRWIGLAILEGQHFALDPASVSVLGPKPGHPQIPVIAKWNAGPLQAELQIGAEDGHVSH
ncbi:histidine phosphatase family protein [Bosea sp. 685]|uniref:histidine phosphatase family protein n=1 Tax=Bosea sp. 685 TaxID=3080057 RepID=UPI0028931577|nr:histidine phosphatase family protein [Bosea sp. 685]WNJ93524.1 histidine phosphatase family protein [Bosea sp. 685]